MATKAIVPRANNEGAIGSPAKQWAGVYTVLGVFTGLFTGVGAVFSSTIQYLYGLLTNTASTSVSTPASGFVALFSDTDKRVRAKDSDGFIRSVTQLLNFSTVSQAPAASTRVYITGSALAIPPGKVQIGTMFRWTFNMTKTAAGVAATTFDIAVGTAGTTADTARVSFTKPGGSAAVDEARVVIEAIVRGPLSASGVMVGQFQMTHNLAATGHAVIPNVVAQTISGVFDVTTANLFFGVCITAGASDAITIQQVIAESWNI